ncbi:hypothetical protein N9C07_06255 [Flavobacteriaceae bacterium]|nr:hypothetical protein [Flavobacteriaceae bacterium]MDC1542603.1 hypothetical protein [Flavobacteriaceae bacterium]MDG1927705.1 hypothetical protein [Flavobacteriaceae bacterium]
MKKHTNKIIGISIIFLIVSCSLESVFSLPNDEKIKTELIGEWFYGKNSEAIIRIEKNNKKTYKLILDENGKTEELIAFSKTINGFNIMILINDFDGDSIYEYYGFTIDDKTLTYSEVNKNFRESDFSSETDLLNFFQKNVTKKDFFINPNVLKRN